MILSRVSAAAIGALLSLLSHDGGVHALSGTKFGSTRNSNRLQFSSSSARCNEAPPGAVLLSGRNTRAKSTTLRAIAENAVATEPHPKSENHTDIPISAGSLPGLTVVAGPGTRITSVSSGVAIEQHFWETKFDEGEFVRTSFPIYETKQDANACARYRRKADREVVDYHAVVQDSWENKFDESEFFPLLSQKKSKLSAGDDRVPDNTGVFDGESLNDDETFVTYDEIVNKAATEDSELESDEHDEAEEREEVCNDEGDRGSNEQEGSTSALRSAMSKSALLHRAGIASSAKKSSRSNGRSSRAKNHVTKSRRGAVRSQGVGAVGRVLGTVRTAARATSAEKGQTLLGKRGEAKPGKDSVVEGNFSTATQFTERNTSSKWNKAVKSTVAEMLQTQDAIVQQESLGKPPLRSESIENSRPPPGTSSMGILGEVVEDKLPDIPPLPGKLLIRSHQDMSPSPKRVLSIRSSVPHSSDDTHIANLRLSVFSKFDEEKQKIFRSRSVEVLNIRRRRGAVVLVAEDEEAAIQQFPTELQARIANGQEYGNALGTPAVPCTSVSPSLTVTPVRGAKITQVSSGIAVNIPTLTVSARGATITAVSPGVSVDNDLYSCKERGSIIGSVECSHQEFRGTMLGNSRRKGSLMYITEVAVRTDARRCGAGAMLMRGAEEVASLRGVESIYLHVDVANRAACAMYEKCGYHYLDKRVPMYAQFTASLNLHDGAMHGRKHYLMCKNVSGQTA